MKKYKKRVFVKKNNPSIKRIAKKCITCGACKNICQLNQGVYGFGKKRKNLCIYCGQCTIICPYNSLETIYSYKDIKKEIKNKNKIVVFQVAPAIRVSLGDEFGLEPGFNVETKIVALLKKLGADYVFDMTFGADLTIMEEATEFLEKINNNEKLPMFTSCCPSWVEFAKKFYPEYVNNISTTKSPLLIQGAVIKSYFAEKLGIDFKNIVVVGVNPCTAKKFEIQKNNDVDFVITTKELGKWALERKINILELIDSSYDELMAKGSGGGVIFGNTGGVTESLIRTLYYLDTNKEAPIEFLKFESVRGLDGIKEAVVKLSHRQIKIAVVNGMGNGRKLLDEMKSFKCQYDFIEIMACNGGCIGGGGQPKVFLPLTDEIKEKRIKALYKNDEMCKNKFSYNNKDIINLYDEYLIKPNSNKAHKLLHYKHKKDIEVKK